jgi:CheY-like chemotaxis protein
MNMQHILVVDDEAKIACSLSKALEHLDRNYRVRTVCSGEEALAMLDDSPLDLLITDLRLPGINGLELIRRVRASKPQVCTILITAYSNDKVKAEAGRLAVYCCFDKPFIVEVLLKAAREALAGP